MKRATPIGLFAASLLMVAAPPVYAARCSDAPWGWPGPESVVKDSRADTIWFVARSLGVDRVKLDRGTIPPRRQGETIGIRLEFQVIASWSQALPRRLSFYVSPLSVSSSNCNPPFRHRETYDPARFRPGKTWLIAAVRDSGPGTSGGYRLADWKQFRPWSEALALRYVLGPPRHGRRAVESPPTLDDLARALDHREQVRRDDALWFWLSIRCGRNYLRWRLDDLDLSREERMLVRRATEPFSSYPWKQSGEVPVPRIRPDSLSMPRKCTAVESRWVADRIRQFSAALP